VGLFISLHEKRYGSIHFITLLLIIWKNNKRDPLHCLLVSRRQLETPQNYDVDSEVHTDDNHSERF
jgi:hypothetical protein